ncbi:MAG: hypothetical protein LBP54_02935 [Campylobacteraceae bacterium]|jgi:predicted nucleic acid-binding Zn ribbon protein|nr:hypothetical protein [Campylobacteraceae bacterium]
MVNKKIINIIIGTIGIVFIALNIIYPKNAGSFYINMFRQTKFETKNFIIDLPKFHWAGQYIDNSSELFFFGLATSTENSKNGIFPTIHLYDFNECLIAEWAKTCDAFFVKTVQRINDDLDVEVYSCKIKTRNNIMYEYIIYKDSVFYTTYYTDDADVFKNFQFQYSKFFFEGVRLKDE